MNFSLSTLARAGRGVVGAHMHEIKSLYGLAPNGSCGGQNGTALGEDSMGGVPQTLIFTSSVFLILLVAFGFLRRDSFHSGRELVQRKWTNIIFRERREAGEGGAQGRGFWTMFSALMGITDEMLLERAGADAVLYLRLTRHLTAVLAVWAVLCLSVALPINLQGDLDGGIVSFGDTTLHNLRPDDPLLWALVALQLAALPLVWLALRHFLRPVCAGTGLRQSRSLMLSRVDPSTDPRRHTRLLLEQHFREAHGDQPIEEIQVAQNVDRLNLLVEEHEKVQEALLSALDFEEHFGRPLLMRTQTCANLCCCACCAACLGSGGEVRATDFYGAEERRLRIEVASERRGCASVPVPVVFVTFNSAEDAQAVRERYAVCATRPTTSASRRLDVPRWVVDIAPAPSDLLWGHLDAGRNMLSVRFVTTNAALIVITFFLTTPALVVNLLDRLAEYSHAGEIVAESQLLTELLPTALLYTVAELLPLVIANLDENSHHWTHSEQHASIMAKTFAFLTLMVLVLPSLGLTSAEALLAWLVRAKEETFRWECVFLPDKGALFVNYVITAAFIGCGLELVRAPELILYYWRYLFSRSKAEAAYLWRQAMPHFPYGERYAWVLLVFTITITNGVSCPLITPAGLIYMCFRQVVDRHNLHNMYVCTRVGRRLHGTAARSALAGVLLLQLTFAALAVTRHRLDAAAMVSFSGGLLTAALLAAHLVADSWFGYNLVAGMEVDWTLIEEDVVPGSYRAPVLRGEDEGEPDEGESNFREPGMGDQASDEELGEDEPLLGKRNLRT